ncbi:MAG TPA: phosphatase PAP2 family protein [Polyangiaceae bacterium]|nr:phosphatase PAP2 family protein [Polyangiaceae bacterium]
MPAFSASSGSSVSQARFGVAITALSLLLTSTRVWAAPETAAPGAAVDSAPAAEAAASAGTSANVEEGDGKAVAFADATTPAPAAQAAASDGGSLKVEEGDGKAVVVADPTTPVIPDKEPIPHRAYQLQWEIDVPLFAIGAALALGREVRSTNSSAPAYCTTIPEGCDENDLNAIDKPFAGTYDPRWSDATDIVMAVLASAPWPMLWYNNNLLNTLNDVTIIYESALTAAALSGLATLSAQRARPFVYGTKAPEDVRTSPNGALSFVSGHTTMAFALSTSTFWTIYRRHGSGAYAWTTLGVGTALATSVAVGRVAAGKHFPTDVITGAAVGAAVGTLMPALHDAPVLVVPNVTTTGAGLDVTMKL